MTNEVFKIKGGQKEFEEYFEAVNVAEIKARNEDEGVVICRKTLREMEELVRVLPDGSQEEL